MGNECDIGDTPKDKDECPAEYFPVYFRGSNTPETGESSDDGEEDGELNSRWRTVMILPSLTPSTRVYLPFMCWGDKLQAAVFKKLILDEIQESDINSIDLSM